MPTPERLVRQAAAHSAIRAFLTRLGSRIPPRLSMLNGLRVGFDSVYASAGPRVDVACGYIGGDTPHVWTPQEWAGRPERWRLPIYVRSFAGNGAADGAQARGWAQNMRMPAGAVIAYDLEQLQDAPMVNAFKAAIAPYVCMVYGAESFVRANPAPWWEAAWNNSPTLDSPSAWGHQYLSTNAYDLNVFAPNCPLWDTQGGPAPGPPPVDETFIQLAT